jgi:hypothetical protein
VFTPFLKELEAKVSFGETELVQAIEGTRKLIILYGQDPDRMTSMEFYSVFKSFAKEF